MVAAHRPAALARVEAWVDRLASRAGDGHVHVLALCLAAAGLLASLAFMASVPFTGDETFYTANARAIADLLTGRGGSPASVATALVDYGFFMPGVSIVLTPLYLASAEPTVALVRAYLALISAGLWFWAIREVEASFGRSGAAAVLLFPTLCAMWLVFASTAWGDLPAGLLLLIVAARAHRIATAMARGGSVRFRDIAVAEGAMGAMVYLRGNTIVAAVVVHVLLLGIAATFGGWARFGRRAALVLAGAAVFAALLAPWSLTASRTLGDLVVTTSSVPLSIGMTFGNTDEICFGPCDGNGAWSSVADYSRIYAEERGISQLDAQRRMVAHALRDVTLSSYAQQVRDNVGAYVTPTGPGPRRGPSFMERFVTLSNLEFPGSTRQLVVSLVRALTLSLYLPAFAALVVANLVILVRVRRLQLLSLLIKGLTISMFLQPFLHPSHARYWPAYATLMPLSGVLLYQWWAQRRREPTAPVATPDSPALPTPALPKRLLVGLQTAYVVSIVAVAAAIMVA